MFGGDRLELDNYNQKLAQALPTRLREKKLALETSAEKIGKIALDHPALTISPTRYCMSRLPSGWGILPAATAPANQSLSRSATAIR